MLASHWADGGKGAAELARVVVGLCEQKANVRFVYDDRDTLWDKINKIAKTIYLAGEVTADSKVRAQIKKLQDDLGTTTRASRRDAQVSTTSWAAGSTATACTWWRGGPLRWQ